MKNNKLITSLMITISILLGIVIIGNVIYGLASINSDSKATLSEYDAQSLQATNELNSDIEVGSLVENTEQNSNTTVSSRSTVDRTENKVDEPSVEDNTILSESAVSSEVESNETPTQKQTIEQPAPVATPEPTVADVSTTKIKDVQISFNMDVSKTTGLSKADFITLVKNMKYDKTGILANNAGWIWECCQKYHVNEIFVLGICGIESGWCTAYQHQSTHNYSSLMRGGKLIPYSTDAEGFEAMIKLLGTKYLSPNGSYYHGSTITGVGRCYCDPTSWPQKVFKCMQLALK